MLGNTGKRFTRVSTSVIAKPLRTCRVVVTIWMLRLQWHMHVRRCRMNTLCGQRGTGASSSGTGGPPHRSAAIAS